MNLKTYKVIENKSGYYNDQHQANVIDQKMVIQIDSTEKLSSDLYFRIKHRG
jgi:hypothetical protein